jgi:hypothetical protein
MATVVLLSSSPPCAFARSPTPADSSPSLPSPSAILRNADAGPSRFKPAERVRDRFSGGFSIGRPLLKTKPGAENIPVGSPGRTRFKQSEHRLQEEKPWKAGKEVNNQAPHDLAAPHVPSKHFDCLHFTHGEAFRAENVSHECRLLASQSITAVETGPVLSEDHHVDPISKPVQMEKALPRRLDWTPIKLASMGLEESETQSVGFSKNLMHSFTFKGSVREGIAEGHDVNGTPMKRRRIDMVHTTEVRDAMPLPTTKNRNTSKQEKPLLKKKNKPPVKKPLTITGLATTKYGEEHLNQGKIAPILELLAATQVGSPDVGLVKDAASKKNARPKAGTKKSRVSKKAPAKSRLVSPTSAMKSLNDQDMIFGSASQLAREESPSLIRDTIEATKQSELFLSSDNISPQRTQPHSIEATSQQVCKGTSRFVKRRNLWGAAGRDQDNALLHVDTIDLSDSPAVRFAFAGKDALLQPASIADEKQRLVQTTKSHMHKTPLAHKGSLLVDIDDIATPAFQPPKSPNKVQIRAYHTSPSLEAPRKSPKPVSGGTKKPTVEKATQAKPKVAPTKPSFAGLSDHDLQRQISAYGFKPIKKREKMVELLERCWEDKYGAQSGRKSNQEADGEDSIEAMTHADFLSKVHDVSARPVPKVKKPRAKRKSESEATATPKAPKRRKKTEPQVKSPKAKTPKKPAATKRKSKASELSEEFVVDIDEIEETHAENLEHHELEPATEIVAKKTKTVKPRDRSSKTLATPPPTISHDILSSPAFETGREDEVTDSSNITLQPIQGQEAIPSPAQTPPLPDLQSQIRAAIMFKPPSPTSSSKSRANTASKSPKLKATSNRSKAPKKTGITPTWREKILMYDPIALEDLATWLNTEGFRAIDEDREVSALDVRDWCEANGVCCYGIGGGWRGANGRK